MIHRLEILDPNDLPKPAKHWPSVDGLKNVKDLKFDHGLNVLFGPNGAGKSTILDLLATLTHCRQGGTQMYTTDSLFYMFGDRIGGGGARITLDSMPVFHCDPAVKPGLIGGSFDDDFFTDGVMAAMSHVSSGEWCLHALNRVVSAAQKPPTPPVFKAGSEVHVTASDSWKIWKSTQNVVPVPPAAKDRGVVTAARACLILDEFDRSLDIPAAHRLWAMMATLWQTKVQIIVAGHSPMVLALADAGICNLIDLVPGYVDACRRSMAAFAPCINADEENPHFGELPEVFKWRDNSAEAAAKAKAAKTGNARPAPRK